MGITSRTRTDIDFMEIALREAQNGFLEDNFPVGAVLTIDDRLLGRGKNIANSLQNYSAHAEASLIGDYSHRLKSAHRIGEKVTLYTTLEPCLMCLATSVFNRIDRIVYACPDPNAGAASIDPKNLGDWNARHWPVIETLPGYEEQSHELLVTYMRAHKDVWKNVMKKFIEKHEANKS